MIKFDQWYLPDGETHLQEWMTTMQQKRDGRLCYQLHKYDAALKYLPPESRRLAVDVGAHVGLWSYWMAQDFAFLWAFEPKREHRECWYQNMQLPDNRRLANSTLRAVALGVDHGYVTLETGPSSSGDTRVALQPKDLETNVQIVPLDAFQLREVDFIKVDCEGYEAYVLEGAEQTIKTWQPVVIVEQKPGHGSHYGRHDLAAARWLQERGYHQREVINGDVILTPTL